MELTVFIADSSIVFIDKYFIIDIRMQNYGYKIHTYSYPLYLTVFSILNVLCCFFPANPPPKY